jgi:hypothetical protein
VACSGADGEMLTLRRSLRGDQPFTGVRVASFEHTLKLTRIDNPDETERFRTGTEPPAWAFDGVGVVLDRERRIRWPMSKQPDTEIDRRRIKVTNNRSSDR